MKLEIEKFLDHIDEWKFKVHEDLKGLTPEQRKTYWSKIHEEARARGYRVADPVEPAEPVKKSNERVRRTGWVPIQDDTMPAPTLYLETSVWGSLAPRQPRDRKQVVHRLLQLLDGVRGQCVVSEVVAAEINEAPTKEADKIRRHFDHVDPIIEAITEAMKFLAGAYITAGVLPEGREADSLHVAAATCLQVDYLVSWNHRHMTRPIKRVQYESVNCLHGHLKTPLICNPFEVCNEIGN